MQRVKGLLTLKFGIVLLIIAILLLAFFLYKTWNLDGRYKLEMVSCKLVRMSRPPFLVAIAEIKNLSDLSVHKTWLRWKIVVSGVMPDGKSYSRSFAGNHITLQDIPPAETLEFQIDYVDAMTSELVESHSRESSWQLIENAIKQGDFYVEVKISKPRQWWAKHTTSIQCRGSEKDIMPEGS